MMNLITAIIILATVIYSINEADSEGYERAKYTFIECMAVHQKSADVIKCAEEMPRVKVNLTVQKWRKLLVAE